MSTPDHERRSSPRLRLNVPLEIYTEQGASPIRGATSDLNLSGCYIETIFPLPVGTRLEVKLQLDATLLILATVVTCDPQVGNGIRFHRMLPEDFEALRAYLEASAQASE
jgi:hypothetical protein